LLKLLLLSYIKLFLYIYILLIILLVIIKDNIIVVIILIVHQLIIGYFKYGSSLRLEFNYLIIW